MMSASNTSGLPPPYLPLPTSPGVDQTSEGLGASLEGRGVSGGVSGAATRAVARTATDMSTLDGFQSPSLAGDVSRSDEGLFAERVSLGRSEGSMGGCGGNTRLRPNLEGGVMGGTGERGSRGNEEPDGAKMMKELYSGMVLSQSATAVGSAAASAGSAMSIGGESLSSSIPSAAAPADLDLVNSQDMAHFIRFIGALQQQQQLQQQLQQLKGGEKGGGNSPLNVSLPPSKTTSIMGYSMSGDNSNGATIVVTATDINTASRSNSITINMLDGNGGMDPSLMSSHSSMPAITTVLGSSVATATGAAAMAVTPKFTIDPILHKTSSSSSSLELAPTYVSLSSSGCNMDLINAVTGGTGSISGHCLHGAISQGIKTGKNQENSHKNNNHNNNLALNGDSFGEGHLMALNGLQLSSNTHNRNSISNSISNGSLTASMDPVCFETASISSQSGYHPPSRIPSLDSSHLLLPGVGISSGGGGHNLGNNTHTSGPNTANVNENGVGIDGVTTPNNDGSSLASVMLTATTLANPLTSTPLNSTSFLPSPSPLAINNALIASAGNRSRKADYVIVAEETAVKNAAGAIAKVLDRLSMDATANGLQAISSCPVFAERKSKNIAAAISVAVKAIAVARDYIANEGHNHEVAFQPYFRDLSTISASSASSASSVSPFRFAPFALRS
eukprot:CAMPEP_0175051722 /NCGR_PEP_ID=MMETSP0052_2-20121109/7965_1 /TAXON_ID=51329 ORGANISM="Polytomella parva, Strain SAG 63-3" /NCGR_SAMPLE_ID=MMETSP0052_2 /ASSEMBLY_ACC=CAM_ASM_000194 /LENGTH=674 /DNA_ID=CAMNT_0016316053 /DNA_START=1345 /DNA_END=3369 /DNA_ORIENTATION=+